jgi:hypothetical protein
MADYSEKQSKGTPGHSSTQVPTSSPGKRTLVEHAYPERRTSGDDGHAAAPSNARPAMGRGTDRIQRMFGRPEVQGADANGVVGGAEHAVAAASSSGGAPLPGGLRQRFESSLAVDLSGVRVHTGSDSAHAASAVGAKAYTIGNDIHFNAGQYDTSSRQGQHLLAHEVAHTAQQGGGSTQAQFKLDVSSPGDALEVEADRSADAMVQGAPATVTLGVGVQRKVMRAADLTDDQKKLWEQQNGDAVCDRIKAAVEKWKAFRATPASYQLLTQIRSGGACSQLSEIVEHGGPQFGSYARGRLGGDSAPYLTEMAAFISEFAVLIGVVPGVAAQDPRHEYSMKKDETSAWNNVPFLPFTSLVIEYKNVFGWHWKRELTGSQLQWKVGVDIKPLEQKGKRLGGGGLAGSGGKLNPAIPLPATISINIDCKAKPSGLGYWGYDNLAGQLLTADGPSFKGTYFGFGVKKSTGGIITIIGSGGPAGTLDFLNLQTGFGLKPDGPDSPLDSAKPEANKNTGKTVWNKKGATISATLIAGGVGKMVATAPAQITPPPPPSPKAVLDEQQWKYFIYGFETGSAEEAIPIPEVNPIALMAKEDVDKKRHEIESIQSYLKDAGINEPFKLMVTCEGFASRRWQAAGNNEAMRKQKNLELSRRRAENVVESFRGLLGPDHEYAAIGRGPAVHTSNAQGDNMQTEDGGDLVEQRLRQIAKTNQELGDSPDVAKRKAELERKDVERSIGRNSDHREARRVNVLVVWRGHRIEWAAGSAAPPVPSGGDGGADGGTDGGTGGGGGAEGTSGVGHGGGQGAGGAGGR